MQSHEYRVVPAPRRGLKAKGARRAEDRFARAVESEMNRMAAEGWEFVRSDTLPCEQKQGWFSRAVTVFQTVLVFRRAHAAEVAPAAQPLPAQPLPVAAHPVAAPAATMPPPPPVAAPAASRFTPPPAASRPANDAAATPVGPSAVPPPIAMPPAPSLSLVRDRDGEDGPNPHVAAE